MFRSRWLLVLSCSMIFAVAAKSQEETRRPSTPAIKITREFLCSEEISPLQYGQFVEYLCNLIPGMWAEMIRRSGESAPEAP